MHLTIIYFSKFTKSRIKVKQVPSSLTYSKFNKTENYKIQFKILHVSET